MSVRVPADWQRRFNIIGAVQFGAIALAVALAVAAGFPGLIPAPVCLIVGGHFFPLATVFAQPQYRATGAALCTTAAAGAVAFAAGGDAACAVVVGAGAAVTLWVTSLHVSLARV